MSHVVNLDFQGRELLWGVVTKGDAVCVVKGARGNTSSLKKSGASMCVFVVFVAVVVAGSSRHRREEYQLK